MQMGRQLNKYHPSYTRVSTNHDFYNIVIRIAKFMMHNLNGKEWSDEQSIKFAETISANFIMNLLIRLVPPIARNDVLMIVMRANLNLRAGVEGKHVAGPD